MPEYIQVVTTVESPDDARRLAVALVQQRLAACVQVVGPIRSTYWWKGQIQTAEEWQCLIKTRRDLFVRLEAAIRAVHPYEVPEILATPVVAGHQPYLDWIEKETQPKE